MNRIVMQKVMTNVGWALVPTDDLSCTEFERVTGKKEVVVTIRQARNPKAHKLYWALMTILADNVDWIPHKDAASVMVKIATHEVDTIVDGLTGEVTYVPRSISFEAMDGGRWSRFFDRVLFVVTSRWLPGNTPAELQQRVFDMIDPPDRASLGTRVVREREAA